MRTILKLMVVAGLGLASQSCGGDEAEIAKFTGTWRAVSGTVTTVCPGRAPETRPVTGSVVWSKGITTDLVQSLEPTPCSLNADVMGATAAGSAPACTYPLDDGTMTLTVPSYTFGLSADGNTATENTSLSLLWNSGGVSLSCTATATASYQKISQ